MTSGSPPPADVAAPARRRWRDGMLWLLGGIVATVVGVNGTMVWIAVQDRPSLVRSDYYEASKHVDAERAVRAAGDRLGWQVQMQAAPAAAGVAARAVYVRIADREGQPVPGITGRARAYRPSDAAWDQPLDWQVDATRPGGYRAVFARPLPGLWRITLELERDGQRLRHERALVLPAPS